jgi:YbgC/YbaW family acyl-CoA thioester hydrolase
MNQKMKAMKTLEMTPESEAVIRFPDCDPFHHLNNSRYLDYFLNAREDHLIHHYGFSIYQYTREYSRGWVVGMNQLAYFKPALLMETVIIQSTLLQIREKDILVEMRMLDKEKTMLKALLWSRFYHVDLASQKSVPHSEELMLFFKPLLNPLEGNPVFEERMAQLKTLSK